MKETPRVIAFSYAKRTLVVGSRERERMVAYASVLKEFHVIVYTHKSEGYNTYQKEGNLHLYATSSSTKVGMLVDAYKIGRQIICSALNNRWTLSTQDPFASSIPAVFLSRYKHVDLQIQIHGDIFNKYFFTNNLSGSLKRSYARWVLSKAQKIRVVSERIKQSLLRQSVSESHITVLPIQANIDTFLEVGKVRTYESSSPTKFLYVGRLAPEKNIQLLLQAFSSLKARGEDAVLLILGDGPEKSFLQSEARRLGIADEVTFLPWTDAVSEVMARADIFCLSSLHEGYAMVLVEAMAAGLPIITTDVGCASSVVLDGEVGRVVLDHEVMSYVEAMQELLKDKMLQARLGRAGYNKACSLALSDEEYLQVIKASYTF